MPSASATARAVASARVGLDREHDQVGAAHRILVRRALDPGAAQLPGRLARPLGVARADDHVVLADRDEASCERAAEAAGPAEDRDPHAGAPAASSTAVASRREASRSVISVFVTTRRTPAGSSTASSLAVDHQRVDQAVVAPRDMGGRRAACEPLQHPVGRAFHGAPADQRADGHRRDGPGGERGADLGDGEDRADRHVRVAGRDHDQVGAAERLERRPGLPSPRARPRSGPRRPRRDGLARRTRSGRGTSRPASRRTSGPVRRSPAAARRAGRARERAAPVTSESGTPSRRSCVRTRCRPRSRSPSENHASPPSAATVSRARHDSSERPQPRSSSASPASA